MPDVFLVIARRWSLIVLLTLAGTAAAFVASLLSPKLYLGTTTALPVNTLVNDKARIFNQNIEALYSEIGTADELDKIEGTAKLDTLYLAVALTYNLAAHYKLDTTAGDVLEKAALMLRRSSDITKTGYGELNIKVWDKDNAMAATLANGLMQTINAIHERLQTENNKMVLQKLREAYTRKWQETHNGEIAMGENLLMDSIDSPPPISSRDMTLKIVGSDAQLQQYHKLINEYELAVNTTPKALLVVEHARPSPWYDRPKTSRNLLLAFLASLLFSFLLAVFIDSRNTKA